MIFLIYSFRIFSLSRTWLQICVKRVNKHFSLSLSGVRSVWVHVTFFFLPFHIWIRSFSKKCLTSQFYPMKSAFLINLSQEAVLPHEESSASEMPWLIQRHKENGNLSVVPDGSQKIHWDVEGINCVEKTTGLCVSKSWPNCKFSFAWLMFKFLPNSTPRNQK